MPNLNKDALDIWNALRPMIDKEIERRTNGMVQRRKAKVTTAPSSITKTIGVKEPFGTEMQVPFLPGVATAQVDDVVWVEYMFGASNAFVSMFANISDTAGGGGGGGLYAGSPTNGGPANVANAIQYGAVDNTSTSTAFTATIPGITSYYDGLTIMLRNGVVTSASGFTIDINGLGAKPSYNNMATGNPVTPTAPTRDTTIFNINYTMMFVYSTTLVENGAWICYRGYNSDTNTIAYQVRTNSTVLKTTDRTRYYRMLFTSADGTKWIPANTQYDNSATSTKTVNTRKINPFGPIVYLASSSNFNANANVSATAIWQQYALPLGYSFNRTGEALTMTTQTPVYVKCAPQSDGSAIMDSTTPIVQALPSTEDGNIYIYLGIAYSATNIELVINHPVYCYKSGKIQLWTGA